MLTNRNVGEYGTFSCESCVDWEFLKSVMTCPKADVCGRGLVGVLQK